LPPALAQIVTRALVVIAVLRATCIEEMKSLTVPVCLALLVNEFRAGTAIDSKSAARPIAVSNSMSVNPLSLFIT
jgi:hypothetical protein